MQKNIAELKRMQVESSNNVIKFRNLLNEHTIALNKL